MKPKFNDPAMAKLYALYRANPPRSRLTGLGSQYFIGLERPERNYRAPPGTLAYAAWAAGRDTARAASKGSRRD